MIIFKKAADLRRYVTLLLPNKRLGLVPTMGALHMGHISLIKASQAQCDITVVSIFVNPTQFNEKSDLEKYPRTTGADIDLLSKYEVDMLYLPDVSDVYPDGKEDFEIVLGYLDLILEGAFRPGHFKGVAQVVHKLIINIKPDQLFMGQKDYQQVAVVRKMIEDFDFDVELVMCPIIRNEDGLAMSSRNVRLTPEHRERATILYKTLVFAKENIDKIQLSDLEVFCLAKLNVPDFRTEYFKIINGDTLEPISTIGPSLKHKKIVACTAVWAGEVRLIDNMILRDR